jgi:hypothetical protein
MTRLYTIQILKLYKILNIDCLRSFINSFKTLHHLNIKTLNIDFLKSFINTFKILHHFLF